ncbi:hypothetical protein VMT65_16335 [Nocardia sp. CDC153]|uniref:hypothetical protein n=1 Tax=Nocardia sp. CDC153 TaxID=3112167 RepID=UPI002DB5A9A5|nr:hypothetical protein [Nocardia sp. CDC153]MEC3954609.1 hypothetical protein [Nocardia sp. CDC153]
MRAHPTSTRISPRSAPPAADHRLDQAVDGHPRPRRATRWHGPRRIGLLAAAATVACSAGVAFAPTASAAITGPTAPENTAARIGILESVAAQPDPAAIPEDFVTTAGYRPVVEAGMLLNPGGDCSSPVPLPAEFDLACKSHDLGYDLLRYAAAHGQPLGPWARQTVDAALERRMHAACDVRENPLSRTQCQVMADIATTAVDLNSIRQDYGDPIYEPFFERTGHTPSPATLTLSGIGLAAGLGIATTVLVRRTRARRATTHTGVGFPRPATEAVAL